MRLPIQPKCPIGAIDDIPANLGIQGGMEFDSPHFCAVKDALVVNIINAVLVDPAKSST
ncbi:hypothetical protein D3C86_2128860 [compost metagenome]